MEEEIKNNNNKKIIIITIIVVVVIGLVGFIIIKNINKVPETNTNETTINNLTKDDEIENKTEEEDNQINNAIKEISELFPKSNDSKVTGSVPHNKFDLENGERHAEKFTFYYNNYKFYYNYIDGGGDYSEITIYNKKTNKKIYNNKNIKTYIGTDKVDLIALPAISNNKLHLLAHNPNNCYYDEEDEENYPYLEYIQIDLSGNELEEKTIVTIKRMHEGQVPDCN